MAPKADAAPLGGSACPQRRCPPCPPCFSWPGTLQAWPITPCPSFIAISSTGARRSRDRCRGLILSPFGCTALPAPSRVVHGAAGQPPCCKPLPAAIPGGGCRSWWGLIGPDWSLQQPCDLAALLPRSRRALAEHCCCRRTTLRTTLLRSLSSPALKAAGEPPLPGRELRHPCRQCIPTPSHQANLIKLPPNLCAKVVRNARAVFHKKYESERPQARKVSGRRLSGAARLCLPAAGITQPRRVPQQPRGDGSFGRGRPSAARCDGLGEPGLPLLPYLPNN